MKNNYGNKATMGKNIQYYMDLFGMTRSDLCKALGFKYTTVTDWINGNRYPRIDKIEMMANYFGISKSDLVEEHDAVTRSPSKNDSVLPFPIIGDVAAGYDCPAIEEYTGEYEHIPAAWLRGRSRDNFFVLRVKGDSMYPDYQDGDRVLVQRQDIVESGAIAVVIYDSENATLKKVKYYREKSYMELIPLNREYAPKRIEKADLNQCRILGEVRRLIRVVKREE